VAYDRIGHESRASIVSLLPDDWTWEGKDVLDFGCGAGRTLRHFIQEAETATFSGCDIDRESIDWLAENLSPPLHVFASDEMPPLPVPSGSFDLVYALSVFTHLTESWSAWLLELHRVLKDGGLVIATFIGPGIAHIVTDEIWEEERIGMNVLKAGQSWDLGGPTVLHSPWWIRAHWGRAFDVIDLRLAGFGQPSSQEHGVGSRSAGQGVVLMRKRAVELTREELERPEPGEPREALAALNNVGQLSRELVALRTAHDRVRQALQRIEASRNRRVARRLRRLITRARPNRSP
jgi:SAM-dependent methyltransferase